MKQLTTTQAAQYLNYADNSALRHLIRRKKLKATKVGRDWLIDVKELNKLKIKLSQFPFDSS